MRQKLGALTIKWKRPLGSGLSTSFAFLCRRLIWAPHPFPVRNGFPLSVFLLPVCIARLHSLAGRGPQIIRPDTTALKLWYSLYDSGYRTPELVACLAPSYTAHLLLRWATPLLEVEGLYRELKVIRKRAAKCQHWYGPHKYTQGGLSYPPPPPPPSPPSTFHKKRDKQHEVQYRGVTR